jgi:hypothetical protein
MTSDQRPDAQLGTGSARSELDSEPAARSDPDEPTITPMVRNDSLLDPGMVTALAVGSHPALPDDVEPNRSGSGGTGPPVADDPGEEGSAGRSTETLLGGDGGQG